MRVRFAPSPTGYLHIGGLRTALYNYLLARQAGGTFVLRIEDTDRSRFVPDAEQDITQCLRWAGIEFDEGPGREGNVGPYHQSLRTERYDQVATRLVEDGNAYIAFDTPGDIESMRERHRTKQNPTPRYDLKTRGEMTNSLTLAGDDVQARLNRGDAHVVRLLVKSGGTIAFDDAVRGRVSFESDAVDDQILVKSDGLPTYHLANIVDDHEMGITHVIRGEEWLPSTPKHILLYEALGWTAPKMAHLPLILSPTGGKLSKRNAEKQGIPVSVRQYHAAGYEPAALINFLAMLGWNPGNEQELFSLEELSAAFSLEKVGQAGVQLDLAKLKWYNEQYLRQRSSTDIAAEVHAGLVDRYGDVTVERVSRAVDMMKDRMSFAVDLLEADYLFCAPTSYDEKSIQKKWKEDSGLILEQFVVVLTNLEAWNAESLESALNNFVEETEIGMGKLMFPLRLGLSGRPSGPGLYDMMVFLGQDESLRRLNQAVESLP